MRNRTDHPCYFKVKWDMETGIFASPDMYHGLTPESSWKEFQEQNWMYMREKTRCPQPCAPGSCFEVLGVEGCAPGREWSCDRDDGTLAFDCCCKRYDRRLPATDAQSVAARLGRAERHRLAGAPTLFCLSLVLPGTYEVDLLRRQLGLGGLGIFGCDRWEVYSNQSVHLATGAGGAALRTHVFTNGTLDAKRGGAYNTSMNTHIFVKLWDEVIRQGYALGFDWIAKLDPDTVFLPQRLLGILGSGKGGLGGPQPRTGVFLNNCFLGNHGPIEVFSGRALAVYAANRRMCVRGPAAAHGQEDWFMRDCFKDLGVVQVDAYNLLLEGGWACKERPSWRDSSDARPPCFAPQVAFHPFKDMESYMHCWAEAISRPMPRLLEPVSQRPTKENGRQA